MPTFALNFSRPGGEIACQYYNFLRLGKEGYQKIHNVCYDIAQFLAEQVAELGPFDIIYDGKGGIPGLCWQLKAGHADGWNLYDFAEQLRLRGWQVPAYALPADQQAVVIQRVLIRHGVSKDLADLLLADMQAALQRLQKHPVNVPLTADEAAGHHH